MVCRRENNNQNVAKVHECGMINVTLVLLRDISKVVLNIGTLTFQHKSRRILLEIIN